MTGGQSELTCYLHFGAVSNSVEIVALVLGLYLCCLARMPTELQIKYLVDTHVPCGTISKNFSVRCSQLTEFINRM